MAAKKKTARKSTTKTAGKKSAAKKSGAKKSGAKKSGAKRASSTSGVRGFAKGTPVRWNTSQGETQGTVEQILTSPRDIKGHHVAASPDDPQVLVKSDKTGAAAAHKPSALKKR